MPGFAQRMRLRLFIEGIEVPIIAATVQCTPNAPAACSIQIPPLPEGTRLLPRSLIHLFFLDAYETESPLLSDASHAKSRVANGEVSPTTYEQSVLRGIDDQGGTTGEFIDETAVPDFLDQRYKLLFGGELVGFQWTKNQAQRSIVLQCLDWSNYWDYAYQWNNTDLFGPGVKALFSGGSTNLFTDFLEDEGSAIIRIIQTPCVQYPELKGLLGGIVHLLEAIGGSYYYAKRFAGQNIFFSLAELRLHITQMITAYEKDPTASRLLSAGYDALFGRTLGGLGQQVSIRQAINALMGIIFHETYSQPCPLYVPGTGNSPSGKTRKNVRQDPTNSFIATTADGLLQSLTDVQALLASTDAGAGGATRTTLLTSLAGMRATCKDTSNRIKSKETLPARAYYASALRSLDTAISKSRSWQPGVNNKGLLTAINKTLDDVRSQMQRAAEFEVVTTKKGTHAARLNQHIFRPDVWFSAPPRCNVLFPEHHHNLTYSRQFLMEPTRFLLKTNDEFFGEDELFDQFYYAPKGFTLKKNSRELQSILANDLLDHELFTGILPVFEKMGELNIFAARSGTVNGKVPKIGLAQRSCNFLYFKYRFAARQLQVDGRFNPYIACGFPGLVIDKYVDPAALALRQQLIAQGGGTTDPDITNLLGTHFLANFTEVEHTVDQRQGTTRLNCSYARQPEEKVEFLGVLREDQKVHKRADQDATRLTVVAALDPPVVGSLGPNMGKISAVQDVTAAYTGQDLSSGQKLPVYQGPPRAGTTQSRISVVVGRQAPASSYGQDVVNLVGAADVLVQFRAFRVSEDVPRYRRETVDLPAEEYIRPGWYGDIWHPSKIGQAYQQFFQTGAITDQQQVDAAGASLGVQGEDAQQALSQAQQAVSADDPRANAPGLLALDKDASIQSAVSFLVETYSYIKQNGFDVDEFIKTYTWRPIATMVDMFGTHDLALDQSGHEVIQGIEGFHSRAFGPYSDLFGLTTPDIESVVGIKRGSTAAQKGDTRARRRQAVLEYVSQLSYARAILG